MPTVLDPRAAAAALSERWSPRVLAQLDQAYYVKVAKLEGAFTWHAHEREDELFFVLSGRLKIELENGAAVELGEGQMYVVEKGLRHRPVAERECLVLLFERASTEHTGGTPSPLARTIAEQLRPL